MRGKCEVKLTRLVLVFALDLENVKEIGRSGVNLNQIFIWFGCGIGELGDFELVGRLDLLK